MAQEVAYADLEIRILDRQAKGYPVELTVDHEQEYIGSYLDPGLLPWTSSGSLAEDGKRLFEALLADERLRGAWAKMRGQQALRRIRLRLHPDAPKLHTIPWELLAEGDPAEHLAASLDTPFSRYLAGEWRPGGPILKRPVKMLIAIANPENLRDYGLQPVDVNKEREALEEVLEGLEGIESEFLSAPCTLPALEDTLREGYHVLHFVGHGHYSQETKQAFLFMADSHNQVTPVGEVEFAHMLGRQLADAEVLHDNKLRLVFLASCQTAERSPADAFHGFAPRLIKSGVPAVLAMQGLVGIVTARTFARTFYRQLLRHGQVDLASNEARSALLTAELAGVDSPVLFMRLRNGRLFGQRGEILEGGGAGFWNTLLKNIDDGECTPILGPGLTTHLLPHLDDVAEALAGDDYPYDDHRNLPRVAQYVDALDEVRLRRDVIRILTSGYRKSMELKDEPSPRKEHAPGRRRRGRAGLAQPTGLAETIQGSNWSERSREILESEPHHQLADLPLPLYVTTNFDNFMTLALEGQGYRVRRTIIPWHLPVPDADELGPEPDLEPSEDPVVLHLFGTEEDPASMVLTQDNYLDYLARISRDHEHLLPATIAEALAQNTLLFLGYRLEDLDLKVITRGLLAHLNLQGHPRRFRVIAQLEDLPEKEEERKAIVDYLNSYFSDPDWVRINVYWGSPQQFVADLHARWQAYVEEVYG